MKLCIIHELLLLERMGLRNTNKHGIQCNTLNGMIRKEVEYNSVTKMTLLLSKCCIYI